MVHQAFADHDMQQAIEQRDVGIWTEAQMPRCAPRQRGVPWVADHQLGAAVDGILDPGGGNRVVHGRVGPDEEYEVGVRNVGNRVADGARANTLQECCDRTRMAQPGAVVDMAAAHGLPHEFLEKIGLLVAALGRTEACERRAETVTGAVANPGQPAGCDVERLFPTGLTKEGLERQFAELVALDVLRVLGGRLAPHEWRLQARGIVDVIDAVAPLDAQTAVIGGAVTPGHEVNTLCAALTRPDVPSQLAAHTAIGADGIDLAGDLGQAGAPRGHQGASRADLNAFSAGNATRATERRVGVEGDANVGTAQGQSDDVVSLHVTAGTQATRALNAGVEVHGDGGVRRIGLGVVRVAQRQPTPRDIESHCPPAQLGLMGVAVGGAARIAHEQLEHHLAGRQGTRAVGKNLHARRSGAAAGRGQGPLAFDFNHASATVARRLEPRLVTEMRDGGAFTLGDGPEGLVGSRAEIAAIEGELDRRHGHGEQARLDRSVHACNSCEKYCTTQSIGLGAA